MASKLLAVKFGGSQKYKQIFNCLGVNASKP